MEIEVIDSTEGLLAIGEEWEALEVRDPHASFYASYRFVKAWWLAYCDDPSYVLHTLGVRHNGALVAVAPLAIRQTKSRGRDLRTLRWASHGDYLGAVVEVASASAASRALLTAMDDSQQWDKIALGNMRSDTPLAHYLFRSSHNSSFTLHVECPYIDLREYADFDDFCVRSLPSHTRKYRNKFVKELDARFTVTWGNASQVLQRMGAVHQAERDFLREHRDRDERHSLFDDPRRVSLVEGAYEREGDAVTFAYEDSAGRMLGYRSCYVHGRTLLSWNSAYEPQMEPYRLGKVLQYDIMGHLFSQGEWDFFDFGAGRYPWKFEWTHQFNSTYRYARSFEPPAKPVAARKPATSAAATATQDASSTAAQPPPSPPTEAPQASPPARRTIRSVPAVGARRASQALRAMNDSVTARRKPPVIWYLPHPTDDAVFMGGSIAARTDRRHLVVLLAQGRGSTALRKVNARLLDPISRDDFAEARVREFMDAVETLGVRPRDVSQSMLTDGEMSVDDILGVISDMAAKNPDAEHRTMSYLDPNADHCAAGKALKRAYDRELLTDCFFHLAVPKVEAPAATRTKLSRRAVELKREALAAYQVWDPRNGRYGIGGFSVAPLIEAQRAQPREHVHGPTFTSTAQPPPKVTQ